jgi:hypothetical protein
MQDIQKLSWIDQLEVTGPIKSIMGFVDELSRNYDKRVEAMQADFQQDIDEILACYRHEKQEFQMILDQQKITIAELTSELKALQQSHKQISVEYKMTQENLETTKQELHELTKALKSEAELVAIVHERIKVEKDKLQVEMSDRAIVADEVVANLEVSDNLSLDNFATPVLEKPKRKHFAKTREFFQQVIADRLKRPVIMRSKAKENDPIESYDQDQDTFSY